MSQSSRRGELRQQRRQTREANAVSLADKLRREARIAGDRVERWQCPDCLHIRVAAPSLDPPYCDPCLYETEELVPMERTR